MFCVSKKYANLAGQEGFEPPSPGFGVRRSTVRATGLHNPFQNKQPLISSTTTINHLFNLFVQSVSSAKSAIFAKFQFVRCGPFIFRRCVVSSFALTTCKCNNNSHQQTPSPLFNNFADHASPNRPAALSDGKPQLFLHRYGRNKLCRNRHIVARHHHLYSFR